LLITPTLPIPAFDIGKEYPDDIKEYASPPSTLEIGWWSWTPFTYPFNLTKQPAATIPCGFTKKDKLPIGLQVVGPLFGEKQVLQACYAFEKSFTLKQ